MNITWYFLPFLAVAFLLAFVRLLRGPHLLDRVLVLDFMSVVVVGMLGVYAITTGQSLYLDIAMVVALLGFLATIGFTFYAQRYIQIEEQPSSLAQTSAAQSEWPAVATKGELA